MTPLAGAGTSVSTLSVETSTTPSSASTVSPTCLSHSRIVPSVTDSPIWGRVIWTVVSVGMSGWFESSRDTQTGSGVQESRWMANAPDRRRLKHWGWGYEDQQLDHAEVE